MSKDKKHKFEPEYIGRLPAKIECSVDKYDDTKITGWVVYETVGIINYSRNKIKKYYICAQGLIWIYRLHLE